MNKNNINLYNKKKLKILESTKIIVSKNGWSENILDDLAKNKINSSDLLALFAGSYKNLLKFSLEDVNSKLRHNVKNINIINFPLHKRIKKILIKRLEILEKDKIFYKKTFYHLLLPHNSRILRYVLFKSVDEMWYLAGDNSTDFNYYTKRLILSGIYTNALLIFFNKNLEAAEKNIDKNLSKVSKIPKFKNKFLFIKENFPIFIKSFIN